MLENLHLKILKGNPGPFAQDCKLYNSVYQFWKEFWYEVYASAGSEKEFIVDDFRRQDLVPVVFDGDTPVAIHLYSAWSLDQLPTLDSHYFDFFEKDFIQWLRDNGAQTALSLEFMTVNSEYRFKQTGIPFGDVLMGLGVKVMQALHIDSSLAVARTDVKVDKMADRLNFDFYKSVNARNFPVALMAGFHHRVQRHEQEDVAKLIDDLWLRREDMTELTTNTHLEQEKVAA